MKNVVHKIYHITFPNNETYVGSTSTSFNMRYGNYRNDYKTSKSPILEISTQYRFNEVNMVEVDRIECPMYDSKIKILEEEWIKKLTPTLNIQKAYQTKEEERERKRLYNHTNREYLRGYDKEYHTTNREHINKRTKEYLKTPAGKLNNIIGTAKSNIKLYTKQNKPDMVKKWEGILEERIQQRSQYRLASQSS